MISTYVMYSDYLVSKIQTISNVATGHRVGPPSEKALSPKVVVSSGIWTARYNTVLYKSVSIHR